MNFWRKCGKIITKNNSPIRCPYNPCGYYALFALILRQYDGETGKINYCSQPRVQVIPYRITTGSISYMGKCIKISQTADKQGKVGYNKSCGGSWQQCYEWDQNGNCINQDTYYYDCYEITVYRLGGCYNDYDTFAEYVYSKCPEITAPFPNVFDGDNPTWDAMECINKNQDSNIDSWYSLAYWSYIPRLKLKIDNLGLNVRIQMNQENWYVKTEKIAWCDGECLQYDDKGNCTNCNGTLYEEQVIVEEGRDGYFHGYYKGHQLYDPLIFSSTLQNICTPEQEWQLDYCVCLNKFNAASVDASTAILNLASTYPENRSNYNHSYQENVIICKSGEYSSWAGPGGCWYGYDMYNEYKQSYAARDLYFQKPDKMLGNSKGIQVYVKVMKYQGTDNNATTHCLRSGTETLYDGIYTFSWGDKLQLPIAHNMVNSMTPINGYCNGSWDNSQRVEYQPTDGNKHRCSNPCKITWYLEVRKLIF